MSINEEKQITVYDGKGNEHLMEILFTYHHDERNKDYVFFFDPATPDEIMAYAYTEAGELEEIEDEEEYAEVEEVFNAFQEDPKIQEIK